MKKTLQWTIATQILSILFAAIFLASCQKNDAQMDESSDQMSPQMKQDAKFISSLGYDVSEIEKADDGYLVEGDIWLTDEWLEAARQQPETRLSKHNGGYLVNQEYQNKLFFDINNLLNDSGYWNIPAVEAVNRWNGVDKCYINITIVQSSGLQPIKITLANKSSFGNDTKKLMKVTPPTHEGKPGSVMLNKDCSFLPDVYSSSSSVQNQLTYLLMHAIGHTLGLGHTLVTGQTDSGDEDWGNTISGTYGYDNKSIMRREANPLPWSGFSSDDKRYLPVAFPLPALTGGSIEQTKTINQTSGTFSINSVSDATAGAGGIAYSWEKKSGNSWEAVSGQTGKNLTQAAVPATLTSEYRRKATTGSATAYSNTCTVTNNKYKPMTAGSISGTLDIDTENPGDELTIRSLVNADCPRDAVSYIWEMQIDDIWTVIPSATEASLTTASPMAFTTLYRRKATCAHDSKYSNVCTVVNKAYLDAGAIPELVEINKTGFNYLFDVISQRPASVTDPQYRWEIFKNGTWTNHTGYEESLLSAYVTDNGFPLQRTTKLRRKVNTPFGLAYTNECTVVNYAIHENPLEGTDLESNMMKLGPYSGEFSKTVVFDTRAEHFQDLDRLTLGGNDVFMELELTEAMYVDFITGSTSMSVWLSVWNVENWESEQYNGIANRPYFDLSGGDNHYFRFPTYPDPEIQANVITLHLLPGKYSVFVQGYKATNAGTVNHVIATTLQGRSTRLPLPIE